MGLSYYPHHTLFTLHNSIPPSIPHFLHVSCTTRHTSFPIHILATQRSSFSTCILHHPAHLILYMHPAPPSTPHSLHASCTTQHTSFSTCILHHPAHHILYMHPAPPSTPHSLHASCTTQHTSFSTCILHHPAHHTHPKANHQHLLHISHGHIPACLSSLVITMSKKSQ